jgi:hypothetical protein
MTTKTRQRLGLLGVLVAAFVVVMFVVSRGEGPAGTSAPPSNQPGRLTGEAGVPQVADVNLEALKAEHDAPAAPQRNLFVFQQKAPPPTQPRAVQRAPTTFVPPVPTGPPPPPPIPLKYIGLLERGGASGRLAILSDGRGGTFHAREGEVIDGRYMVIRVGPESIELSYVDGRGRQSIRLSGQ